jgi:hypothetical protein
VPRAQRSLTREFVAPSIRPSRGVRAETSAAGVTRTRRAASHGVSCAPRTSPAGSGRSWVPPAPYGVFTPFGVSSRRVPPRPKPRVHPPCTFVPLQRRIVKAPHAPFLQSGVPTRISSRVLPLLGFPALRHMPGAQAPVMLTAGPPAVRDRVRGLATPLTAMPGASSRRRSAGASMGFPLQGVPLARDGYSSRSPCPPDLAGRPNLPGGIRASRWPPGLPSRGESVLPPGGRSRRTVDAFLGFSPSELSPHPSGLSLVVARPTFSPLGGVTSRPAWTSRSRGVDGSALPVSGPPALMGFRTFRLSWRAIRGPGSGLMDSPRAGPRLTGEADCALSSLEAHAIAGS